MLALVWPVHKGPELLAHPAGSKSPDRGVPVGRGVEAGEVRALSGPPDDEGPLLLGVPGTLAAPGGSSA